MPASAEALRVLLVVEPSTPTSFAVAAGAGRHRLAVNATGLAMLSANGPALRQADAVVVEIDPAQPAALAQFERLAAELHGQLPVVAAIRELTVAATRQVLRAGAIDVLPLPFTADDLAGAVVPARPRPGPALAAVPAARGKIVAFVGAIGGCGTTSLAVQAGVAWSETARVCLIDLDVQFGNAALYLDLGTQLGIADILDAGARLDVDLLRNIAQTHGSGLSVVASPPEILPLDGVAPENIDKMLNLAAQAFDIVLVDLPGAWTTWSMRVVELADVTLMVTSLTVPGIHQARRQSEIIAANGFGDRLRMVVNRVIHPMFGKINLDETQALLGRRIDFAVANDYPTISTAIDRGKWIGAVKSKSRVEKDLRAMVAAIATALRGEAKP